MFNWKNFLKKNKYWILLLLVIAVAIFLRFFSFSDWLYFKMDQARDARLAYTAFNQGAGDLPLLGPRAAGTFLRLGPISYYFQYFSAELFGSVQPHILAYPDLLFSILTIPLFFIFLRKFFSANASLMITTLYAFSFIIIQYSRFAWNPNSIPFWGLLFILSIYNATFSENKKGAGWWLVLGGFSYAIVSQLHFIALVGFPIIGFIFWIFYFPKQVRLGYWFGALAVILFLYIPVILSDIKTGGDNIKQFLFAISDKTGGDGLSFFENFRQISISFFMFLSSFGHPGAVFSFWGGIVLIFGSFVFGGLIWKREKEKRAFLCLVFVWFLVFIFLQIKTNISYKPRFFLPIAFLPFVFWGIIYAGVLSFEKKWLSFFAFLSFPVLLFMNFNGMKIAYSYFNTQDISSIERKIFIQQDDANTMKQLRLASDYMVGEARMANKKVCFYASDDYKRSYEYIFDIYHQEIKYDRISKGMKEKENCLYFSIAVAKEDARKMSSRYEDYFDFEKSVEFGRIAVWHLEPKDIFLNYGKGEDQNDDLKPEENSVLDDEPSEEESEDSFSKEEVIEGEVDEDEKDNNEGDESDAVRPPRRTERVFWKDLF